MKTMTFLLSFFIFLNFAWAGDGDWQLYKSEKGVQVYFKKIQCVMKTDPAYMDPNQELVVFKITNTTNSKVNVSWTFDIWFGTNCRTCGLTKDQKKPYFHSIDLEAGKSVEGNCESKQQSGLMLFSSFYKKDPAKNNPMTKFELTEFSVKKK